nr:MAG TPA: hypothetical protein [Caudoviricetes sp.]
MVNKVGACNDMRFPTCTRDIQTTFERNTFS